MKFTNLRSAPPVDQQPRIKPLAWRVVRTEEGELLVLVMTPEGSLRITSAILEIHPASRTVTTGSGRVYELEGPPIAEGAMAGLFGALADQFGLGSVIDVSASVWDQFEAATQ